MKIAAFGRFLIHFFVVLCSMIIVSDKQFVNGMNWEIKTKPSGYAASQQRPERSQQQQHQLRPQPSPPPQQQQSPYYSRTSGVAWQGIPSNTVGFAAPAAPPICCGPSSSYPSGHHQHHSTSLQSQQLNSKSNKNVYTAGGYNVQTRTPRPQTIYGQSVQQPAPYNPNLNAVIGTPDVTCRDGRIAVRVRTLRPFAGRLYVSGLSGRANCIVRYGGATKQPNIQIATDQCELQADRISYPRAGLEYTAPIIVSFHSELLTEADRLYHVKCRYFQTDQPLQNFFEVGLLPTVVLTNDFPMPMCRYLLQVGEHENSAPAEFARIGEAIYHRWQCDSELHAIRVRNCFVDDGSNRRYQILDENGCTRDQIILPQLTYDKSLTTATAKTHVFKFADRPHVYFKCEIQLCVKEEENCRLMTPPRCATPPANPLISASIDANVRPFYPSRPDEPPILMDQSKPYVALQQQQRVQQIRAMTDSAEISNVNGDDSANNETSEEAPSIIRVADAKSQRSVDFAAVDVGISSPSLYVLDLGQEKKLESYVRRREAESGGEFSMSGDGTESGSSSPSVRPSGCFSGVFVVLLIMANIVTLFVATALGITLCRANNRQAAAWTSSYRDCQNDSTCSSLASSSGRRLQQPHRPTSSSSKRTTAPFVFT